MDYTKFIKNLKIIRTCEGMTAKELSKKCKLRQLKRIADIEDGRGKPSLDEVIAICKELNMKIDPMLNETVSINYHWD